MNWGYIAGLIDGEGSISIVCRQRKEGYPALEPVLRIVNTNREALEQVAKFLGGFVVKAKADARKNHNIVYNLCVSKHANLKKFLEKCMPHFIIKKKQAELMLKFLEIRMSALHSVPRGAPIISMDEFEIYKELCNTNRRFNRRAQEPKFKTWKDVEALIKEISDNRGIGIEKRQKIIQLRQEGKKLKEISEILQIPLSTVRYYSMVKAVGGGR